MGTLIIFEGSSKGEDKDFDATMAKKLFPEIELYANTISAGGKKAVSSLHDILDNALTEGILPFKVYSITDKDSDESTSTHINKYRWDAYHIESYLLKSKYIAKVINKLVTNNQRYSVEEIDDILRMCAKESLDFHALHETRQHIYKQVSGAITFKVGSHHQDISGLCTSIITVS